MSSASSENLFERHGGHYHRQPLYLWLGRLFPQHEILELDCGTGEGVGTLGAGLVRRAVGFDTNSDAIERARRMYGRPNIEFSYGSGDDLPFDAESFDVVVALRRPFDPFQGPRVREILRVLKPSGVLVAALPNPAHAALPVPGSHDAPVATTITAHQLQLELRRHFPEVHLLAESPLMGFLVHDLRVPDAALDPLRLDASLMAGRLDETYTWLALCSSVPVEAPEPLLLRLRFDQLVAVLRDQGEEQFEQAGRVLSDEPALGGFEERLVDMHRRMDPPGRPRTWTPSSWATSGGEVASPRPSSAQGSPGAPPAAAPVSPAQALHPASPGVSLEALAAATELAGSLSAALEELGPVCAARAVGSSWALRRLSLLQRHIEGLQAGVGQLAARDRELRTALLTSRSEAQGLGAQLDERDDALSAARQRIEELEDAAAQAEAERASGGEDDLQIEIGDLRDAWRADRDELREIRAAHKRVEQELLAARQQSMLQEELVRSAEQARADLAEQVVGLRSELAEQRSSLQAAQADVTAAARESNTEVVAQLGRDLGNLKEERIFLEQELRRIDEENARLRHELTVAREALANAADSARAELQGGVEREQRVRERVAAELGERLDYLTTTLDSGRERVDQVAAWIEEAMRKVDALQSRLP